MGVCGVACYAGRDSPSIKAEPGAEGRQAAASPPPSQSSSPAPQQQQQQQLQGQHVASCFAHEDDGDGALFPKVPTKKRQRR